MTGDRLAAIRDAIGQDGMLRVGILRELCDAIEASNTRVIRLEQMLRNVLASSWIEDEDLLISIKAELQAAQ